MYLVFSMIEKGIRGAKIISKLAYYKMKYGKRLKVGKNVHFRKGFIINISKNGYVEIGDGTFFNNYCSINCHDQIIIGRNNLFGEGVRIYDHNHIFNKKYIDMEKSFKCCPIVIGDNNWFGSNVIILSKAKVGNDNVVGAGVILNQRYDSGSVIKIADSLDIKKRLYE